MSNNITYKGKLYCYFVFFFYITHYHYVFLGWKVFGSAESSSSTSDEIKPSKSILCFMGTSLFKKWSTVVRLLPLANLKSSDFLPIVHQVIRDIKHYGLFVDVIFSDNYPLNLFKLLGDGKQLLPCVQQPNDSELTLPTFRFCAHNKDNQKYKNHIYLINYA